MFSPPFAALRPLLTGVALVTALAACQSAPPPSLSGNATNPEEFGRCNDAGIQWAVGKTNDEATIRRLKQESRAGIVNPIGPTTITSRDIRHDRLRVFVDANNVITAVRCG